MGQRFKCSSNRITKIENLPYSLIHFNYKMNVITHVDDVDKDIVPRFKLTWYNKIRHLQRRIHLNFKHKNYCSTIIQHNCEAWLWKPICRDSTRNKCEDWI